MRTRTTLAATAVLAALITPPAQAAAPSANGQIAYDVNDEAVYVADPDGTAKAQITPTGTPGCCPGWSPDGTKLAMAGSTDGGIGTAIVNADGTGYHVLPIPIPDLNLVCNAWSPSGERLACEGFNDADDSLNGIYTASLDGLEVTRLTHDYDLTSHYSPDGSRILFEHDDRSGQRQASALYTMKTDGTDWRRVTPRGSLHQYLGSSWSPDGSWILFGNDARIWLIHPDGTALHQVPLDTGSPRYRAMHPSWSPDGSHIVFAMFLPGHNSDIFTAALDGSDVIQVTDTPDEEANPSWGTYSPTTTTALNG